jgi:hypothetical protein
MTTPTVETDEIVQAAQHLLDVLADRVPATTIHYAVETIRGDLANLIRLAGDIKRNQSDAEQIAARIREVAALLPGATVEDNDDNDPDRGREFISLDGVGLDSDGDPIYVGPFVYIGTDDRPSKDNVWTIEFRDGRPYRTSDLTRVAPPAEVVAWIKEQAL